MLGSSKASTTPIVCPALIGNHVKTVGMPDLCGRVGCQPGLRVALNDVMGSRPAQSLAVHHARITGGGFLMLLASRGFPERQAHSQKGET